MRAVQRNSSDKVSIYLLTNSFSIFTHFEDHAHMNWTERTSLCHDKMTTTVAWIRKIEVLTLLYYNRSFSFHSTALLQCSSTQNVHLDTGMSHTELIQFSANIQSKRFAISTKRSGDQGTRLVSGGESSWREIMFQFFC